MKFSLVVATALSIGLCANDCQAQKAPKPSKAGKDAIVDSMSYAYGLMLGTELKNNFAKQDIKINSDDFIRAMKEAMKTEGGELKMDEATAMMVLDEFGRKMQEKEMLKAQEAAKEYATKEEEWFKTNVDTKAGIQKTASGLRYEIVKAGTGEKPKIDQEVTTHYHGTFTDGRVFDSSVERGEPVSFPVAGVIPGWTEVLQLMPTGSKWKVYVPFNLAYGAQGAGDVIPPYSTLVFEIELISFK